MRWLILVVLLAVPLLSYGQGETPTDTKPETKVIVPTIPVPVATDPTPAPTPPPEPTPVPVTTKPKLEVGKIYAIQSDTPLVVCVSPPELATALYEEGPVKYVGVFVDSLGEIETRTFKSKYVVTVNATKGANGEGEILIYPEGTKSEAGVLRIKITVGQGPRPPPIDPDTPDKPDTPDQSDTTGTVVVKEFRVIWVTTPGQQLPRGQLNALSSTVIWKWLMQNCTKGPGDVPEWRKWAPNQEILSIESPKLKEIWNKVKQDPTLLTPTPKMIVVVNDDAKVYDQPATPEATLEFLKLKKEGK